VLISFSSLAITTYNADTQTVDIGPGARWGEVITALDPYNVSVVGGRIGQYLEDKPKDIMLIFHR
jgi:hypothetical protein